MNCPFLRETRVRSCRRAPQRKLIPRTGVPVAEERCANASFLSCPLYRRQNECHASQPPCPLLDESLVQYCSASAITRFVPYSEAVLSQCGGGAFRYCDLYLEIARATADERRAGTGIAVDTDLFYTANHWWVDLPAEGPCHLGADAFVARLLGDVVRIDFATPGGLKEPVALLSTKAATWHLAFPAAVSIARCNLYLRRNPGRLGAQPYTQGWLFEAALPEETAFRIRRTARTGDAARAWMDQESQRVNQRLQDLQCAAADGGLFTPGLLDALGPHDAAALFHEFCSPACSAKGDL